MNATGLLPTPQSVAAGLGASSLGESVLGVLDMLGEDDSIKVKCLA